MLSERIILYGLGRRFQRLKPELHWECVVALTDSDWRIQPEMLDGVPVISPQKITEFEFDYVVVTPRVKLATDIYDELSQTCGVNSNKIISIDKYLYGKMSAAPYSIALVCKKYGIHSIEDKDHFFGSMVY